MTEYLKGGQGREPHHLESDSTGFLWTAGTLVVLAVLWVIILKFLLAFGVIGS